MLGNIPGDRTIQSALCRSWKGGTQRRKAVSEGQGRNHRRGKWEYGANPDRVGLSWSRFRRPLHRNAIIDKHLLVYRFASTRLQLRIALRVHAHGVMTFTEAWIEAALVAGGHTEPPPPPDIPVCCQTARDTQSPACRTPARVLRPHEAQAPLHNDNSQYQGRTFIYFRRL